MEKYNDGIFYINDGFLVDVFVLDWGDKEVGWGYEVVLLCLGKWEN